MGAQSVQIGEDVRQIGLYEGEVARARPLRPAMALCQGCRGGEARYGFRDEGRLDEPGLDRPRALCFRCFRIELTRRQQVAARLARGWNGKQVDLPLPDVLDDVNRRRRRAQIAARHALGI